MRRGADPGRPVLRSYVLHPAGLFAERQRLLQSGQALPLLFPNHELSFSYPRTSSSGPQTAEDPMIEKSLDWSQDTIAGAPAVLMSGRLFPHFPCRSIAESQQKTKQPALSLTTTRDLPAQLATSEQPCPFCLLIICSTSREGGGNDSSFSSSNRQSNKDAVERMSAELEELMGGIAVIPALLEIGSDDDDDDDTIDESPLFKSTSSISSCETEDASIVISLRTSLQDWKRRKLVLLDGTPTRSRTAPRRASAGATPRWTGQRKYMMMIFTTGYRGRP